MNYRLQLKCEKLEHKNPKTYSPFNVLEWE